MKIIADFHTHSRYAMACSKNITIRGMEETAMQKGINLISTGDFTHPLWMKEIIEELEEIEDTNLFKVRGSVSNVRFMLGSEVCTVFEEGKKTRKIHNCILLPSIESAKQLSEILGKYGSLSSDGRPILMIKASELVEIVFKVDKEAFVFPAHAWTPWFGVLGAISGFDSLKDAYEDSEKHIHALETGLSSDPLMNWRLSQLDKYALLSNSDMHSLPKMGREANQFDISGKITYDAIINAIKRKDNKIFTRTIEFYPEEGKYHYDGHRKCEYSIDPQKDSSGICRICGKRLTIGVLHRIDQLADRESGFIPRGAIPYIHAIPLNEIIAHTMKKTVYSPFVVKAYRSLIDGLGDEFYILTEANIESIAEKSDQNIADSINNIRENRVHIEPGYDGVFGKIDILKSEIEQKADKDKTSKVKQKSLFDFGN